MFVTALLNGAGGSLEWRSMALEPRSLMAGITLTDIVPLAQDLCLMDKNRDGDEIGSRSKSTVDPDWANFKGDGNILRSQSPDGY